MLTGGSKGIGAVTARVFAGHGADIAISARNHEQWAQRAGQILAVDGAPAISGFTD